MLIDLGALTPAEGFVVIGDMPGDYAGYSVSNAGDVNGDGIDDFIIGARLNDDGGTRAGAAYVIFGKASGFGTIDLGTPLTPAQGFKIQGDVGFDYAGRAVGGAGDVNGDGFDDLIVGANGNDSGGTYAGAAYVIFGKATGFGTIDLGTPLSAAQGFKIQGDADFDRAGRSVSGAGDVNGDGFDDLIVGAYGNDSGGGNAGAAYVIFGKASGFGTIDLGTPLTAEGFKIQGDALNDQAGISVSGAGDVNGDGFDDLIVGSRDNDSGGTDAGAAYVIFGKASGFGTIDLGTSLTAAQGFKIQGDADRDFAGYSVSGAGDVNGDGFDDLIVGAYGNDSGAYGAGAAYVIFGKASGFGTIDLGTLTAGQGFKIRGDDYGDFAGRSVSGAGDVNGDGFADLLVGADGNDSGAGYGQSSGAAYVIFGKASGFGTIDLGTALTAAQGFKIQGDAAGDLAGRSVSGAGDVNRDGLDDLLIGAHLNDSGGGASNTGVAYVIFGVASPPVVLVGDANGETLRGGGSNDRLFGQGGNDILNGNLGNDQAFGGDGGDTVNGGAGNDILEGNAGNDTLDGGADNDNVNGGDGDDILTGGEGDDSLVGGFGSDTLNGGAGVDIMKGGDGGDIYFVDNALDRVIEDVGYGDIDTVNASLAFYILPANVENLNHTGTFAIDYRGNELANVIDAGTATSAILFGFGGEDTLIGTEANDRLFGGTENDTLIGLGGADTLVGEDGDDTLEAGAGNDNLIGGAGNDTLDGGRDNDNVNGGDGDDDLFGGAGTGNDSLVGGAGNDRLDGGAGNDIMVGGDGDDTYIVDSASDTVIEQAGAAAGLADRVITFLNNYTLPANVEIFQFITNGAVNAVGNAGNNIVFAGTAASTVFSGLAGNDTLNGGAGLDYLFGGIGSDTLVGNGGNDVLLGEDGDDAIDGGLGNDNIKGGAGIDTLSGGAGTDNIIGQDGNDTINGGDDNDSLSGNGGDDIVNGDGGNDLVFGNDGNDTLGGGDGDDRLAGGADNDALTGGDGFDILNGEGGDDVLDGGDGDDRLFDSDGFDELTGGLGADDFRFTSSTNADFDVVTDFETGVDKLNFQVFDTDPDTAGVQNPGFTFIGADAFNFDGTAKLRFELGELQGDVDGDGLFDFIITVIGDPVLPGDLLL